MASESESRQILQRLDEIKSELDYIKDCLVDADAVLNSEDLASLDDADKDLEQGKTKRL
ncbi:hypothetical protein KY314_03925 [Candidatus Woesearchaeota archaeon]|nr:hypothetical protein [Candidatus Woesearchaeota archaeon]